jgi:hypothetical protein
MNILNEPEIMKPILIEHNILKKLLKDSYNDVDGYNKTSVQKYSMSIVKENWFYIMIIILVFILIIHIYTKRRKSKKEAIDNVDDDIYINDIKTMNNRYVKTKDNDTYSNDYINNYYTNIPRIK